ncbi:MAG: SIMPL domain-containing protein [Hyphomonas sp.]|nr:SIMPL domain-containing protein [Hyphomonas sp.]
MRRLIPLMTSALVLALILPQAACAQMQALTQQAAPMSTGHPMMNHNSIQPETTLQISAEASIKREPDIAYISAGVREERATAADAMAAQAKSMTSVFDALAKAGVAKKDMQTSSLSLSPRYDYVQVKISDGTTRGEQRLAGYVAANQLTVKVRDLDTLGGTLDSLVRAGGNTLNGVSFALDDDSEVRDEARREAMKSAMARADLYAKAAGLKVLRIVTIDEGGVYMPQPAPMARRMEMAAADSYETPMAGGEVGYTASVSVLFELGK